MALSFSKDAVSHSLSPKTMRSITDFLAGGYLESPEQIRRFELLRLAFFALKLRKLEQRFGNDLEPATSTPGASAELEFRCSLLRHVIFQQVLTLIQLDAREQALQIIDACRK